MRATTEPFGAAATARARCADATAPCVIKEAANSISALGAVIASITGDPAIFVSGGTEHQCAPGAAPIAAIVRAEP